MTFPAILPLDDLSHIDIIGSLSHDKDIFMTNLALKPDSVEPVREYDRRHAGLFCILIQRQVGIFRVRRPQFDKAEERDQKD
jgi:hypothetical protein